MSQNDSLVRKTFIASFGSIRFSLLVVFTLSACVIYLHLDAHTLQRYLALIQSDPWGTAHIFIIGYAASVVIFFPCMILQVVSGSLYGFWSGVLLSWLANSIGQTCAFLLGRYLFSSPVRTYLHARWPGFPAIDTAIKKDAWRIVCLLRLSPIMPYNILNYALALTPVSLAVYTIASCIATVPWTCLYVYVGTLSTDLMDLAHGKISYGSATRWWSSALTIMLVILTTVYGYFLAHRAINAVLREPQGAASAPIEYRSPSDFSIIRVAVCAEERVLDGVALGEVKQGREAEGVETVVPANALAVLSL
ncbi:hypothetical protein CEUSTIGMA_g2040.t1 [Chlamydomonas eustigma]|uniref:VTT domain-containing protein n=1 Tax=Chlamydomonas eustigma TaxID=1157962 RepID=A0A250WVE3_9CHLO|nr:hypothetical protein CEUSTIGMA_g2040.t1 [Chlamydomonas eustigma]|eukprot:GAX74592.1 hypothetical protein CEUSTIGMA_g2040.t1 [Chlamydomonas eustigma]